MNPPDHDQSWARLTAAARRTPAAGEVSAPYGFATRVVAETFSAERSMRSLFERFSLRAVGVASLLAGLSVVAHYSVINAVVIDEELAASTEDPVSLLLGPIE